MVEGPCSYNPNPTTPLIKEIIILTIQISNMQG